MSENTNADQDLEDNLIDTSINDAKWLLGGVATLGFLVMSLGLFASAMAV